MDDRRVGRAFRAIRIHHRWRQLVACHRATFDATWPERTVAIRRTIRRHATASATTGGIWFVPAAALGPAGRDPARVRRTSTRPP